MRIRSIRPEFWRSDDISALVDWFDRLLFIGLWSYVDDNGVGVDDYRTITADLFAKEEDPTAVRKKTREGLASLADRFLILRYTSENRSLLYIPTWDKHQRIDRPSTPRYLRPSEEAIRLTRENATGLLQFDEPSRHARDTLDEDSLRARVSGEGEKGRRGEGEKSTSLAAQAQPKKRGTRIPEDFQVTPEMIEWKQANTPLVDGRLETRKFVDYWTAKSGRDATKQDWVATWRNWMRNAEERAPRTNGYKSQTDANIAALLRPDLRAIEG